MASAIKYSGGRFHPSAIPTMCLHGMNVINDPDCSTHAKKLLKTDFLKKYCKNYPAEELTLIPKGYLESNPTANSKYY